MRKRDGRGWVGGPREDLGCVFIVLCLDWGGVIAGRAGFPVWRRQQPANSQQQPLADSDCGFSEPAGVGAGFGLWIFRAGGGSRPDLDYGFAGPAQ